jgi:hypothetical protein
LRNGRPQVRQIAREHDAPVVDDDHVLTQLLDEIELVAGEQHCGALCGEFGQ